MDQRSLALIVLLAVVLGFGGLIIWDAKVNNRLGLQSDKTNWQWDDKWDGTTPIRPDPKPEVKPEVKPETKPEIQKPTQQVVASSYEDALKQAGQYGMPIFLYFEADWCSWCGKMKRETLADSKVKEVMKNYILFHVNTDQNRDLTKKFGARALPTYVVTNCKEEKIKSGEGYQASSKFVSWLDDSSLFDQPKTGEPSKAFMHVHTPFTGQGSMLK